MFLSGAEKRRWRNGPFCLFYISHRGQASLSLFPLLVPYETRATLPWTGREMSGMRVFWSIGSVVWVKNLETHQQKSSVGKPFYLLSCFLAENSFLKFWSWSVCPSSYKGSALTPESLDLVPELNQNACSLGLACISRVLYFWFCDVWSFKN